MVDEVDEFAVAAVGGVDGRRRGERNGAFKRARRRRLGSRSNIWVEFVLNVDDRVARRSARTKLILRGPYIPELNKSLLTYEELGLSNSEISRNNLC